jgi:protein TonB
MKSLSILLLVFSGLRACAQENETFYIFNGNWEGIKDVKKAKYFIHSQKVNDTCWQWDYYNYIGPRIKTESYKDEQAKIPNGFFAYYNNSGYLDSCGYVSNSRKDRYWTYFRSDSGKVYLRETYDHGKLIRTENYEDSTKRKEDESSDKTFAKVEVESAFVGGAKSWQTFLNKNLQYPQRAVDAEAQGMVWVLFVVDTNGKVTEPVVAKSVEYSLDQESLRIIQLSPDWNPAFQNGQIVKSYKKQPIVFQLQ